jgi:signal transduction histidine kinase
MGVLVAAPNLAHRPGTEIATVVLAANSAWRTLQPLPPRDRRATSVFLILDLTIIFAAVVMSGQWDSPFVFSLIVPVFLAGFGGGFVHGFLIASIAVVAVTAVHAAWSGLDALGRDTASALLVLELAALLAGYARHVFVIAEERHEDAVGRMAQLTEANALLLALHEVAQTLPSSLDLEETLLSARSRLRELFDFTAVAVFLADPSGDWTTGAAEGVRLPARMSQRSLPAVVRDSLDKRQPLIWADIIADGATGVSARGRSGLYVPLVARGRLVALLAMEHIEPDRFHRRELDLVNGVVEPLALAIDNALWFRRLRSLGAEEERVRIARELHDRTAQSLAYVSFELDRLANRHADDAEVVQLRDEVRNIVSEVRETLYELRAGVTDQVDLRMIATEYVERYCERTGIVATLHAPGSGRVPARVEQELFRILQEALRNIEQHAGADRAWITWEVDGRRASLEVLDNGHGFDPNDAGRPGSYGLVGMRERADEIGARLRVDAEPGRGTRLTVEWEGRT